MSRKENVKVRTRGAKVRGRIRELEHKQASAMEDISFYGSVAFREQLERDPHRVIWDRPSSPAEYEEVRAATSRDDLVDEIRAQADSLPGASGSLSLRPHAVKVALLADTFLFDTLDGTADIRYLSPDNWRDTIKWADVLLLASTWRGRFEDWHGTLHADKLLRAKVIPLCRMLDVPVIFYSKEDPPNYAKFLQLAREADHIVTSDENKVPNYTESCPRAKSVTAVSFGVNPRLHHPIGSRRFRRQEVLFAGSWLRHKYPERRSGAKTLFDGVLSSGRDLLIMDRNTSLGDPKYFYPEEYLPFIGPGVGHDELMRIQRVMDVHLNVNSVRTSPTMYANRAVELMAMGGFVLSNYSMAVNNFFPEIQLIDEVGDVGRTLDAVSGEERYRAQMSGLRGAFRDHAAHEKMGSILKAAGFDTTNSQPRVAVTADEITQRVHEIADRQTVSADVLSRDELAARCSEFDVALHIDPSYDYGPFHAQDMVNGFAYTESPVITRIAHERRGEVVHAEEHEFVPQVADAGRSALWLESDAGRRYLAGSLITGGAYAIDPFGVDTAPADTVALSEPATSGEEAPRIVGTAPAARAGDPLLTVIVPVYNNGQYLVSKCFRSLQRSSIFDRMEILLIDDGSTDGITIQVVEDLARRFPRQVRAYANPTGGSGSASRPRNQGLDMASAPYVTYLDPDNEALGDGYARLLDTVKRTGAQFAIGNMLKLSTRRWKVNNNLHLKRHLPKSREGELESVEDALSRTNFQPMSIQALVADVRWLRQIGLHQPLGALGQDSFAFQQMLHGARRVASVPESIHVYYGSVSNSMVNTVGPGFYRKYLPMERARSKWLRDVGLMDTYCEKRADPFFDGWMLRKFNENVADEVRDECRELIDQLAAIYDIEIDAQVDEGGRERLSVVPRTDTAQMEENIVTETSPAQ